MWLHPNQLKENLLSLSYECLLKSLTIVSIIATENNIKHKCFNKVLSVLRCKKTKGKLFDRPSVCYGATSFGRSELKWLCLKHSVSEQFYFKILGLTTTRLLK